MMTTDLVNRVLPAVLREQCAFDCDFGGDTEKDVFHFISWSKEAKQHKTLFMAQKEAGQFIHSAITLSAGSLTQTGGGRALAACCLGHLLGLLSCDDLDVGGRAHVGVDASVGAVGAAAGGAGSVDLKRGWPSALHGMEQ